MNTLSALKVKQFVLRRCMTGVAAINARREG